MQWKIIFQTKQQQKSSTEQNDEMRQNEKKEEKNWKWKRRWNSWNILDREPNSFSHVWEQNVKSNWQTENLYSWRALVALVSKQS